MWHEQFEEIIRKHLPFLPDNEPLTEDLNLRDFGLDSMAMVEVLALLEEKFNVRFADDAMSMENFATPRTLQDTLSRLMTSAA